MVKDKASAILYTDEKGNSIKEEMNELKEQMLEDDKANYNAIMKVEEMIPMTESKISLLISSLDGEVKGVEKDLEVVKKNVIEVTNKVKDFEENGVAINKKEDGEKSRQSSRRSRRSAKSDKKSSKS